MLKKDPSAPDGCRAPKAGEIMKNPTLAATFRKLGEQGKPGFYAGEVAEQLIKVVSDLGGHLTLEDLQHHADTGSEDVDAISLRFTGQGVGESTDGGLELWEHPPNGQGIVALMALGIIQELEKQGAISKWSTTDHNSTAHLHAVIEALRIAFADAHWFVTDPNVVSVPSVSLISPAYLASRAKLFSASKAAADAPIHGSPAHLQSDTVYFCASDAQGNAISFINSNYGGYGTAIVPKGCGFTLQNRGANFSLDANHPNVLAPRKRPYHTIIPGLVTFAKDQALHSVFGVMGGFMQPQGHVQVLLNQAVFKLNPQAALDAPRICIGAGMPDAEGRLTDATVYIEEGISEEVVDGLRKLGHHVQPLSGYGRGMFGRGQIIRQHFDDGVRVWSGGSDLRGDGHAAPF